MCFAAAPRREKYRPTANYYQCRHLPRHDAAKINSQTLSAYFPDVLFSRPDVHLVNAVRQGGREKRPRNVVGEDQSAIINRSV